MRGSRLMRRLVASATLLTASLVALPAASSPAGAADTAAASQFISLTNSLRASRGLPALSVDGTLTAKAQGWAQTMANAGSIFHSNLASGAPANWQRLGENVGRGGDVVSVHNAFVASPGHLANLVDPGFRYVGVGVVNVDGGIYVAEVFMQTASQPTQSTPAPAAGTPSPSTGGSRPVASAPRSGGATPAARPQAPAVAPVAPPPPPAPERLTAVLERLRALDG